MKSYTGYYLQAPICLWSTLSLIMNTRKSSWKQKLYYNWWFQSQDAQTSQHPAGVSKFLENLLSNNFIPQIILPAKITETTASLIDNILINNNVLNCISGNINISRQFTLVNCLRHSIRKFNRRRQLSNFL